MRAAVCVLILVAAPASLGFMPIRPRSPLLSQPHVRMQANLLTTAEAVPPPEKVVAAVEALYQQQPEGTRLTAADLAAESGIPIDDARAGLKELATALAGAEGLSVSASSKGDLLYSFPSDVRQQLSSMSNAAKARDAWNSAKPALQTVGRVTFGLALFASIAFLYIAIQVVQSESRGSSDRDERDGGGMMGMGERGGGMGYFETRLLLDLIFPPPYGFYRYGWFAPPPAMSLPEAIFSFVFGDGDPNAALRAARLRGMAEVIRTNGGAVVAESLAPFLDPPSSPTTRRDSDAASANVDESWMLPAVTDLGGRPEVAADGTIVYVFDDLTVSAIESDANLILADPALAAIRTSSAAELAALAAERSIPTRGSDADSVRDALREWAAAQLEEGSAGAGGASSSPPSLFPAGYLREREAPFSNAEGGQLVAAGALGLVNFGAAAYLGNLLSTIPPGVRLDGELALIASAWPFLAAYAVAYLAIPAARFVKLQADNAAIQQRNAKRLAWRDALRSGGSEIAKRLQTAAKSRKGLRLVGAQDVDFDSSADLAAQRVAQQPDLDDFDKRLREVSGAD